MVNEPAKRMFSDVDILEYLEKNIESIERSGNDQTWLIRMCISEISTLRRDKMLHANTTLEDIRRLRQAAEESQKQNRVMSRRMGDAYFLLFDYDGHYDEKTGEGSLAGLAGLVREVSNILNGGENDRYAS